MIYIIFIFLELFIFPKSFIEACSFLSPASMCPLYYNINLEHAASGTLRSGREKPCYCEEKCHSEYIHTFLDSLNQCL